MEAADFKKVQKIDFDLQSYIDMYVKLKYPEQ